jgi:hypothetical protein
MNLKKKKTLYGWVTFTEGHVSKEEFVTAVNDKLPVKKHITPDDVTYIYSDIERGPYGVGRRFWINKEPKTEPITAFIFSEAIRNRIKAGVKSLRQDRQPA